MERLYQIISRHFSQSEIANLAADLGIYVPSNADPNSMARELFSGARRNLRLDALFNEVHRRKAALKLDLGPNLYELIAGTFNEAEAAELARNLGLDRLNVGLGANGLIGWNNDDFFKNKKAQTIQETALKQGLYGALLVEMKNIRPSLDLTVFQQSVLPQLDPQGTGKSSQPGRQPPINPANLQPQTVQYIQYIFGDNFMGDKVGGDKVGGDKVEGDKAGGDIIKGVSISGVSGSAVSFGGDAVVGNQVKDVQGDVSVGGGDSPERDALLLLIERIKKELEALKSELEADDFEDVSDTLQEVRDEAEKDEPSGRIIARKFKYIAGIVRDAGIAAAAANQLGSQVEQAIQVAQRLFGG